MPTYSATKIGQHLAWLGEETFKNALWKGRVLKIHLFVDGRLIKIDTSGIKNDVVSGIFKRRECLKSNLG